MNTKTAIILGVFLLLAGAVAGYLSRSPNGRYQMVNGGNGYPALVLDTATGRLWEYKMGGEWMERLKLPADT